MNGKKERKKEKKNLNYALIKQKNLFNLVIEMVGNYHMQVTNP